MGKFPLGQTVMTRGVSEFIEKSNISLTELDKLINRHHNGDWGNMCVEDRLSNDYALKNKGRLVSSYKLRNEDVWIITEWDRSVTTVLFPNEY